MLLTPGDRRAAAAHRPAAGPRRAVDAERGRRHGALQRRVERHRPAGRVGAGGLRRRRPAARRCSSSGGRTTRRRCCRSRRRSRPSARGRSSARPSSRERRARRRASCWRRAARTTADALLELAVEAARAPARCCSSASAAAPSATSSSKSTPTDLVSEADLASERAIRELLAGRRPDDGFVGEEGDSAGGHERPQLGRRPARRHRQLPVRDPAVVGQRRRARRATARSRARSMTPTATSCSAPRSDGAARRSRAPHGAASSSRRQRPATSATGERGAGGGARGGDGRDRLRLRRGRARGAGARARARSLPRVRDIRRFGSAALDLDVDRGRPLRRATSSARSSSGTSPPAR